MEEVEHIRACSLMHFAQACKFILIVMASIIETLEDARAARRKINYQAEKWHSGRPLHLIHDVLSELSLITYIT
jgi:hypothetical protein